MPTNKPFTGKLAEPLEHDTPSKLVWLTSPDKNSRDMLRAIRELERIQFEEELHKLSLLFDHYNLDVSVSDPFATLALALARDFVPGFKKQGEMQTRRGAKTKWGKELVELHAGVNQLIDDKNNPVKSVKAACKELAKLPKWREFVRENDGDYSFGPDRGEALRQAYYLYKSQWRKSGKWIREEEAKLREVLDRLKSKGCE